MWLGALPHPPPTPAVSSAKLIETKRSSEGEFSGMGAGRTFWRVFVVVMVICRHPVHLFIWYLSIFYLTFPPGGSRQHLVLPFCSTA